MASALRDALLFLDEATALVGFVLVAGPLAFWVTVAPNGRYDRKQLLLVDVGLWVLAVATVLGPVLLVVAGGLEPGEVPREVWASVLVRFAVLAALGAWLTDLVAEPILGARRVWAGAVVVALSATFLAAPVGSDAPRGPVVLAALLAHVVAAAVWLGGAVVIAVAGLPMRDLNLLSSHVRAFSRMTIGCVVTVLVSSGVLVLSGSSDLYGLVSSTYGLVMLLKAVVFVAMVVIADHGRRHLDDVLVTRLRTGADTLPGIQAWSLLMAAQVVGAGILVGASVVLTMIGAPG